MKDKEWLKKEIESDGVQLEYLYENYYTDDKAIMIDDVRHLIDQLGEPEITEEMAWEVIERANHYHIAPADVWKYKEAIQKGILPNNFTGLEENPTISKKETVYYADNELEKLAVFIMKCFPNEPRRIDVSESAADVAIRLLTKFYEPPKTLQVIVKNYDSTVYTTDLPEDEAMKLIEGWKE